MSSEEDKSPDNDSWPDPDAIVASIKDSGTKAQKLEAVEAELMEYLGAEAPSAQPTPGPTPTPEPDQQAVGRLQNPDKKDPHAPQVTRWMTLFMRALKGIRLYPQDNPILLQYMDNAHRELQELQELVGTLTIRVREDRLFYSGIEVYVEPEAYEGLPFTLFSHSIQQVALKRGIPKEELWRFIEVLTADHAREERGEDLVTTLWRMEFPHIEYVVFDILTVDPRLRNTSAMNVKDEETERLKVELEGIVEQLQAGEVLDDDELLQKNADHLETPTANVKAAEEESAAPDTVRARLKMPALEGFLGDLSRKDGHEGLIVRLTELLLSAVRVERDLSDDSPAWQLLEQLLAAVLKAHQFDDVLRFVERVEALPAPERHLVDRLMNTLCSEQVLLQVVEALDSVARPSLVHHGQGLLRRLGPRAYDGVLQLLHKPEKSEARTFLCELVIELCQGKEPESRFIERARTFSGEVLREMLGALERLPARVRPALIWRGAESEISQVRLRALLALQRYKGPQVDRLLVDGVRDPDPAVRGVALRIGGAHQSAALFEVLQRKISGDYLSKLEAGELKLTLAACVDTGGTRSVPLLAELLNASSAIFMRKSSTDVQVAAAQALGMQGSSQAREALEQGAKTLNRRVNAACTQAMERQPGTLFESERVPLQLREELPSKQMALEPVAAVPKAPPRPQEPDQPPPVSKSSPERLVMKERMASRIVDPRAEPDSPPKPKGRKP